MPIVDIELVLAAGGAVPAGAASALADTLGAVFAAPAGRVWVKLAVVPAGLYAENAEPVTVLPVFVRVLLADLPSPEVLSVQSRAIAGAIAGCLGREPRSIHIEFAPPGRGRVAFGGELLR